MGQVFGGGAPAAGAEGNIAEYDANGALVDSGVSEDSLSRLGARSTPAVGFDTVRTPNANRLTRVEVSLQLQSTVGSAAEVQIHRDWAGDDVDVDPFTARIPAGVAGTGSENFSFYVPAGGDYEIQNTTDPAGGNAINTLVEITL